LFVEEEASVSMRNAMKGASRLGYDTGIVRGRGWTANRGGRARIEKSFLIWERGFAVRREWRSTEIESSSSS
jgi:hypothetical protein